MHGIVIPYMRMIADHDLQLEIDKSAFRGNGWGARYSESYSVVMW